MQAFPSFNQSVRLSVVPVACCWSAFFRVIFNCEIRTSPIPQTNPASKEAGELGRTRGTCFVARRFESAFVAELL